MSRQHRFHTDVHGDSITVETRTGMTTTGIELLINGKVVAFEQIHGKGCAS